MLKKALFSVLAGLGVLAAVAAGAPTARRGRLRSVQLRLGLPRRGQMQQQPLRRQRRLELQLRLGLRGRRRQVQPRASAPTRPTASATSTASAAAAANAAAATAGTDRVDVTGRFARRATPLRIREPLPIPPRQRRPRVVRALREVEDRRGRVRRAPHVFVRQHELLHGGAERRRRRDARGCAGKPAGSGTVYE